MYHNLEAELCRKNIDRGQIAQVLGINTSTVCAKLRKKDRLKLHEARLIWEKWFSDIDFAKLFEFTE